MNAQIVAESLREVGGILCANPAIPTLRIVLAGGSAGLLGGLLGPTRTTADCDVVWIGDERMWESLAAAAAEAARKLGLPPEWLNRDCAMYAWCLPLAWQDRCEQVGRFGPLDVMRLSRIDLIASKVMSAPRRPQDLEDLRAIRPSHQEIGFVASHLDRLEAEDLDRRSFGEQRAILGMLGGGS